jgi:hypothetical protein
VKLESCGDSFCQNLPFIALNSIDEPALLVKESSLVKGGRAALGRGQIFIKHWRRVAPQWQGRFHAGRS